MDNVETNIAKSIDKRDSANASARNRKRRKKNGNKKPLILIVVVLVIVALGIVLIIGALDKDDKKDSTNNKVEQQDENNDKVTGEDENVTSTIDEILEQEATVIETEEVRLFFPEKWSEQVRAEVVEDDTCVVKFYGKVDGKDEVALFDIVFGETDGILIGTLDDTEVYLIFQDIEFDSDWTEEEQNEIYAMQEDVNYTIGMLEKEAGFVPAS